MIVQRAWHLEKRKMGKHLTISKDGLEAAKHGDAGHANSSVVGCSALDGGIFRWRCHLTTMGSGWIMFGVSQRNVQDDTCHQSPYVCGWSTAACRYDRGQEQANAPFNSTGETAVDLELRCDAASKLATLTATGEGKSDTICGIKLPVYPFFNICNPDNKIRVEVRATYFDLHVFVCCCSNGREIL